MYWYIHTCIQSQSSKRILYLIIIFCLDVHNNSLLKLWQLLSAKAVVDESISRKKIKESLYLSGGNNELQFFLSAWICQPAQIAVTHSSEKTCGLFLGSCPLSSARLYLAVGWFMFHFLGVQVSAWGQRSGSVPSVTAHHGPLRSELTKNFMFWIFFFFFCFIGMGWHLITFVALAICEHTQISWTWFVYVKGSKNKK